MPMNPAKFVPYEMKTSIVRVLSYEGKNPQGTLSNPFLKGDMAFQNLTQLLLLIDDLQDNLSFPQESMESRSFCRGAPKPFRPVAAGGEAGKLPKATFKINIMFRQNASWQGGIVWMEQGMESQFRSALELIMLMDSVLAQSDPGDV